MKTIKKDIKTEFIFFIVISLLLIVFRYRILQLFSFEYTDSDQTIMWLGAKDYIKGLLYEPRFYGQAYNTMLESLLAIPLIKFGVPLYKSLPIVTVILTLFPVYLLSIITYTKKSKVTGIILLCIISTLPIEYSLITSMSRGFVTGIAISSLSFLYLHKNKTKGAFFFVFLFSVLAFTINANSIILSIPISLLIFLKNLSNKDFYIFAFVGLFVGLIIHFSVSLFYIINPYYNLHSYHINLSFKSFKYGITHLDIFFNNIVPIFWNQGWILVTSFFPFAITFYKKKRYNLSIISLVIPLSVLATLFISKVHDGTDSIFFSFSRMYLAVPIVLLFIISFFDINEKKWMYFFVLISIIFTSINFSQSKMIIEKNLMNKNTIVTVLKVDVAYKECNELASISKKNKIDLIITLNNWLYDVYNYGCKACIDQFPETLSPNYERRTWRLLEDENKIYNSILIIDSNRKFNEEFNFIKTIDGKPGFYVIKNNKITTKSLLKKLNIEVRKYK